MTFFRFSVFVVIFGLVLHILLNEVSSYDVARVFNGYFAKFRPNTPPFWNSTDIAWAKVMRDNYKTILNEVLPRP